MNADTYIVVAGVLFAAGAIPALVFVVFYSRMPWWRTEVGRHLMISTGVLGIALAWASSLVWLGDYPGRFKVGMLLCLAVAATLWHRLWLLVRAQRDE